MRENWRSRNVSEAGYRSRKPWPADCVWPEPIEPGYGLPWEADEAEGMALDGTGEELLEIRSYYERLAGEGVLDEDWFYRGEGDFSPEIGEEYWDQGFLLDAWEEDLTDHMNLLKVEGLSAACEIREIIGYEFVNENLLRQAFTRRAFAVEYGLSGCSEELEFLGDSVLNGVVTREMIRQLTELEPEKTDAPFACRYDEGELSRIRNHYVSKEYLAERTLVLGLDRYILYGTGEERTESGREDALEALIGAVAVDSGWDREVLDTVVDRLLCIQLGEPDLLLTATFYDMFNAWHQKHFGRMPEYTVDGREPDYHCTLRYLGPENDKGLRVDQRIDVDAGSRSKARERAAEFAYRHVVLNGLWINLKDAGIVPELEHSINQLQELYQKKYVEEPAVYEFREMPGDRWRCDCECAGIAGHGEAGSKVRAKKEAAYRVLCGMVE